MNEDIDVDRIVSSHDRLRDFLHQALAIDEQRTRAWIEQRVSVALNTVPETESARRAFLSGYFEASESITQEVKRAARHATADGDGLNL